MKIPWRTVEKAAKLIRVINKDELVAAIKFTRESTCNSPYLGIRQSGTSWLAVLEAIRQYIGE